MVSLVACLPIRRYLCEFMNVTALEYCTHYEIFDIPKFTTPTILSLLILHELLLSVVGLKVSPLPTWALKSPKIFLCGA
jgi:hypothetical protein